MNDEAVHISSEFKIECFFLPVPQYWNTVFVGVADDSFRVVSNGDVDVVDFLRRVRVYFFYFVI